MTPTPSQSRGARSLTENSGFSRTSATTTFVFSFPGTPRHSLPVERTHSAPCAAAMGYKGEGGASGLEWEKNPSWAISSVGMDQQG